MSLQIQPKPEDQQQEIDVSIAVLTWFEENKRMLAIGLGLVSAVVVVGIVNRNMKASKEHEANMALFGTLPQGGKAANAASLAEVASRFSGTKAAERAELLAATQLFEDAKYAEAQKAFETFVAAHPDSPLAPTASLGVASSLDAQNKANEAIAAYAAFLNEYKDEAQASDAKLAKARVHESAGQFKEALAIYDDLGKGGFNAAAQDAALRRATLLQAHPELAPAPQVLTNAVTVPAAAPKP